MERSLISLLNFFVVIHFCCCQTMQQKYDKCDCTSKAIQDSLVEKYLENGAEKLPYMYNDPKWQLYCDSLIALCPNIAFAYQHKGVPYIKNGEYEKAFFYIGKAVELDPQRWTAYRGFCKFLFTKDYEGAILDFQKAQQLMPNGYEMDHTYLFFEGLCNLELRNYSEAEKNLKQDIFIQTNGDTTKNAHFNSSFYLGVLYYEMKNYTLAKEYLQKCISEYKQHPNAHYYLAMVFRAEKNSKSEKQYLQNAKQAFEQGYGISEDNVYYANYPHQIRFYEVEQAITDNNSTKK